MPSNSAQYQREYRKKNKSKRKYITVSISPSEYDEIHAFARAQGLSLSSLLREATNVQMRGSQFRSKALASELQELRFLVSNIANNMNQMAHHSHQIKHVIDENGVLQRFAELDALITSFVNNRMKSNL
jgi:hypothetical protein